MARIVESLAITIPIADPNVAVDGTFTFEITVTMSGSGNGDFSLYFEYDDGTNQEIWYWIPASGGGLACPAPNPIAHITEDSDSIVRSKTITGLEVDTYYIRGRIVDWINLTEEKYTGVQVVTVSAGGYEFLCTAVRVARLRGEQPQ